MRHVIHCGEQGTYEWNMHRIGKITGSHAKEIMVNELYDGKIKESAKSGKFGDGYKKYLSDKIAEMLTVEHNFDSYVSPEMQHGIVNEPIARLEYSLRNMVVVDEVSFVEALDHLIGVSPDGMPRGLDRGLEIKCFGISKHVGIIRTGDIPKEVYAQCQYGMMVTDLEKWDFVIYNPFVVGNLKYHQITIDRNEEYCKILERKAIEGSEYILKEVELMRGK